MESEPLRILFLCTHNSARSILAEAIMNHLGKGKVRAFSAGSFPRQRVHPGALRVLAQRGIPCAGLQSKSWDCFALPDAPRLDLVITVCDAAAGEVCPLWPGAPLKAHWGMEDPSALSMGKKEAETMAIFSAVCDAMERRVRAFLDLPWQGLDKTELCRRIEQIGIMDQIRENSHGRSRKD